MTRRRALPGLALASVLAAACGSGPTASPSPSGAAVGSIPVASTAGTAAPVASDAASATPGAPAASLLRLALDTSGPIIASDAGPAGKPYVLPAGAARDSDGTYWLLIVWFGPEPGDQVVTLSHSEDGRAWTIGTEAIFTDLGMNVADPGPIPTSLLQLDDGSWAMYGWATRTSSTTTFWSWRAIAPAPEGPWTLDVESALAPGPSQAWDSETASIQSVQRTEDGYLAWYEGQPPGRSLRGDIGLATSTDGRTWRKADDASTADVAFAESDPVIRKGICGAGTEASVFQAQVERLGDRFMGTIGGFRAGREAMDIYGIVSDDGFTWRCGGETPLLRFEDIPDSEGIHTIASMPLDDGSFALLIESLAGTRSELWLATVEPVEPAT